MKMQQSPFSLSGKNVIVAGGLGLIGKSVAVGLVELGCQVVIFDVAEECKWIVDYPAITYRKVDLQDDGAIHTAFEALHSQAPIHAVVNCVYPRGPGYGAKVEAVSAQQFRDNVSMHLGGFFPLMKEAALYFKSRGIKGSIVSFSSIYGFFPPRFEVYDNTPMTMPVEYSAVKAGLIGLNRYFAKYFKGEGIRFNLISPGGIRNNQPEGFTKAYDVHGNSKGMLDPGDMIGAVAFLVSDSSAFVDGQDLVVDDGWTL